nr:MAG TPA_asm: hypothetical protein [Caudoviricetes sp.]
MSPQSTLKILSYMFPVMLQFNLLNCIVIFRYLKYDSYITSSVMK